MINTINLIWIIPLCICLGILAMAFVVGASTRNRYEEIYEEGVKHGLQLAKYKYELAGELHEA